MKCSPEDLIKTVSQILQMPTDYEVVEKDGVYIWELLNNSGIHREEGSDIVLHLSKEKLETVAQNLNEFEASSETAIVGQSRYEALILIRERYHPPFRSLYQSITQYEPKPIDGITYRFPPPSDELLWFILLRFSDECTVYLQHLWPKSKSRRSLSEKGARKYGERNKSLDAFINLKSLLFPDLVALRLCHDDSKPRSSETTMEKLASGFLFHISSTFRINIVPRNVPFYPILSEDESKIRSYHFALMETSSPPQRLCIPELVHRYQSAIGTGNPFLEFISYYQIAEYFFEKLYYSKHPSKKANSTNFPVGTIDNKEALGLTLKKYVLDDLHKIRVDLQNYGDNLLKHYAGKEVEFSDGIKVGDKVDLRVDFTNKNKRNDVLGRLKNRIYQTRNALVHSKESSSEGRYKPFQDDKVLAREVPLLRCIAERIIVNSAEPL